MVPYLYVEFKSCCFCVWAFSIL